MSVIVPFAGSPEHLAPSARAPGRDSSWLTATRCSSRTTASRRPSTRRRGRARIVLGAGRALPGLRPQSGGRGSPRGEWLLFIDADTVPTARARSTDLFEPAPGAQTRRCSPAGFDDSPRTSGLVARHAVARAPSEPGQHAQPGRPSPTRQTANCAVRADAFAAVGGLCRWRRAGRGCRPVLPAGRGRWRHRAPSAARGSATAAGTRLARWLRPARHATGPGRLGSSAAIPGRCRRLAPRALARRLARERRRRSPRGSPARDRGRGRVRAARPGSARWRSSSGAGCPTAARREPGFAGVIPGSPAERMD